MASRHTTSIVDISEIEDDEAPLHQGAARLQGRGGSAQLAPPSGPPGRSPSPASAHLYLFHEDVPAQQRIPNLLSSMINPSAGGQPTAKLEVGVSATGHQLQAIAYQPTEANHHQHGGGSSLPRAASSARQVDFDQEPGGGGGGGLRPQTPAADGQPKANLGILSGVYFPCVQNIFGVILFIRMVWIVGTAGVPAAFALVFICCCVTLTTSISLSAIATNGIVPAGGSYFMISRSLGPECGGAVGTMFFLGTTVAGAMYITGAVEIMLNYLCPSWGLFGDFQRDVGILYHNIRVYGSLLLIIVGLMVWIGVKFVSKLAPIALFCVLFSIASIYAGIFINYNGRPDLMICVLGDRLVTLKNMPYDESSPFGANQLATGSNSSARGASAQELASQFQLRRTKALCTFEKLRYVYCPGEDRTQRASSQDLDSVGSNGEQPAAEQQESSSTSGPPTAQDEKRLYQELFKRPPNMSNCDPYFMQNRQRIHLEKAVPGIASGVLFQNLKPRFRQKRTIVSYDEGLNTSEGKDYNNVFVDITTSFTILISIYFPSCTGILAGSNRSGDLADAQKSIPRGTIAAQLTTSFVYLSCIILFGSTFNNLFIRDKFGESMGGQLAVTQIAWPHPYVILIGGLLSTLGASLQSLVGAPRILQGIAKDEVIPCFSRFAKLSARGEPENAIIFTLAISWLAVLIGNLDFIAPILTLSLVMCYFFINLACTLHSLLGSPNWRPRFKHYHWSISTLGCLLCLFVMIVSSWVYFLVAIFLASCIYKYIEFHGAEKEWGDGKQGLALSAARYNLLRLKQGEPHTKNWRPQLLLFCKLKPAEELEPASAQAVNRRQPHPCGHLAIEGPPASAGETRAALDPDANLRLAHPKLLTFASQLKAGKGLTIVSAVIEGDFRRHAALAARARSTLQESMQRERVKGFADVLVAPSINDGLCYQIQTAGLGGLKHNTVIVGWPAHWRRPLSQQRPSGSDSTAAATELQAELRRRSIRARNGAKQETGPQTGSQPNVVATPSSGGRRTGAHEFIELMRNAEASQNSLLVLKGVDCWPESCDKLGGYIDIWWIVNDGGLLMLLPYLLRQHRTWKSCQLRIFTVASPADNMEQMRKDLAKFLYHLRIEAQVDIVEMNNTEISDYAYERTLLMEQRGEIIKRFNVNRKQSLLLEQEVDGRVIRFRIRKPSVCSELEDPLLAQAGEPNNTAASAGSYPMVDMQAHDSLSQAQSPVGEQPSPSAELAATGSASQKAGQLASSLRPDETNVHRMHTALTLNEAILKRSKAAKLVIINLPGVPKDSAPEAENNYMEFIEVITDNLERVLLVQNGGREVITIHS